jgi:hypothetical protein
MAPEDIVMMYDDYDVETDKRKSYYPTWEHVHGNVLRAYFETRRGGGDVLLYMSCHGFRKQSSISQNNSAYIENVSLAERTVMNDKGLIFLGFRYF